MQDAALVGEVNGPGEGFDEFRNGGDGERFPFETLGKAAAVDILERHIRAAVVGFADLVDLDDVRVLQAGHGFDFDAEAGPGVEVRRGNHLHGHDAVQCDLAGFVNDAHATPADFFEHLVTADEGRCAAFGTRRLLSPLVRAEPAGGVVPWGGVTLQSVFEVDQEAELVTVVGKSPFVLGQRRRFARLPTE